MATYKVKDPQGNVREIQGPDGASDSEVIAQAQKLFTPPEKPVAGSEPLPSTSSRVADMGMALGRGAITGGPLGVAAAGAAEGMKQFGVGMDRLAHKSGEAVSQALAPYVPGEVAGGAGYVTNVAAQAIPTVLGGGIVRKAAPILEGWGESLMRSALKPSGKLSLEDSSEAVKTFLTHKLGNSWPGANVNQQGIATVQNRLSNLRNTAESLIQENIGKTVNKFDVARAGERSAETFGNQVASVSDSKMVASKIEEFLNRNPKVPSYAPAQSIPAKTVNSPILSESGAPFASEIPGYTIPASGSNQIPIRTAHELKQGTYKILGDKAYSGELKSAEADVQKQLARGLKEEIEKQIPEIGTVNAEQSTLINALKVAISREAVSGNKDPIGLGFIAANPYHAAAFLANRSEFVKSLLARALYHGAKPVTTAAGATAGGLIGAQSGRE